LSDKLKGGVLEITNEQKIIRNKVGLVKLAETLGNVSQACKVMGYSRDGFYRFKELYEQDGELAMQEISRKKPCLKNRAEARVEQAVIVFAIEKPAYGQLRVSNELKKQVSLSRWAACAASGCGMTRDFPEAAQGVRSQSRTRELGLDRGAASRAGEGERREGSAWRDRDSATGLPGRAGHLLCRDNEGRGAHLSADFH
jgi:hypothetical protein